MVGNRRADINRRKPRVNRRKLRYFNKICLVKVSAQTQVLASEHFNSVSLCSLWLFPKNTETQRHRECVGAEKLV
jgi:hypothetical protein